MNTSLISHTADYAAAVREALADLPAEDVEELTDGLEADLAEAWGDSDGRPQKDAAAYAQELRAAAGFPPADAKGKERASVFNRVAEKVTSSLAQTRENPAGAAVLDFLNSLRPAWWLLRGWAAYWITVSLFLGIQDVFPPTIFTLTLALIMVLGSVWVAKRSWGPVMRKLIVIGNIFAVFVVILMVDYTRSMAVASASVVEYESYPEGLYLGDKELTNLFAYDENGTAIPQVQLFDQDGEPVTASLPGGNGCLTWVLSPQTADFNDSCPAQGLWVPEKLETGASVWNIFPMRMVEGVDNYGELEAKPGAEAMTVPPPLLKVPALAPTNSPADSPAKDARSEDGAEALKE